MSHKDPEAERAYQQSYYSIHLEKIRAKNKAYYRTHGDDEKAHARRRYLSHRDGINGPVFMETLRVRNRRYAQTHRAQKNDANHEYRARLAGVASTATAEHEKAIKAAYKGRCAYCGRKPKQLTIDHVIPLAKGGSHIPENLVPACKPCNSAKRDREAPSFPAIRLLL